ncbi:hypothetical protein ACDZ28_29780 [Paenibacillus sp. RS8]|uniref:hypothetical protein n=1 Tax=Paenibacillus sp. RS8 TaxID=3242681 RepID=UPI0035C1824C
MKPHNHNVIHRNYKLEEAGIRKCGDMHTYNPLIVRSPLFLAPLDGTVHIIVEGEVVILKIGEILFLNLGTTYQMKGTS